MIGSARATSTARVSDAYAATREVVALWAIVRAVDDLPGTPETNAKFDSARQALDDRLRSLNLDPADLEGFLNSARSAKVWKRLDAAPSRSREGSNRSGDPTRNEVISYPFDVQEEHETPP